MENDGGYRIVVIIALGIGFFVFIGLLAILTEVVGKVKQKLGYKPLHRERTLDEIKQDMQKKEKN